MPTEVLNVTYEGHVVTAELNRPPANHFDETMLTELANLLERLGPDPDCRALVLCSAGKHFCAGADFSDRTGSGFISESAQNIYAQAVRIFAADVPIVAAVQGSAVGGGLGLACAADFRVASPQTRFVANFSRLGFHQGFGLSVTLPEIVGRQAAAEMLYTSARITGERARDLGLADRLVPEDELRPEAHRFAAEIAAGAPLAVTAIRRTLRQGLADRVRAAVAHELSEQDRLTRTEDAAEGIRASLERRSPTFHGR
jgi:2-(1,2-epoxy-1,2-dihydrophenyl)acetyl-CoA isomerase